jgi:hypothetical protein
MYFEFIRYINLNKKCNKTSFISTILILHLRLMSINKSKILHIDKYYLKVAHQKW